MENPKNERRRIANRSPRFAETRWTLIFAVQQSDDTEVSARSMNEICLMYWYPLYAYVRRRGYTSTDAEDVVQSFFEKLIAKESLLGARPETGRLRGYLLSALRNHMSDQWDKQSAIKRGGGAKVFSIDSDIAQERWQFDAAFVEEPDAGCVYDREWALNLLEQTLERLRSDYCAKGLSVYYNTLEPLIGPNAGKMPSYDAFATELQIPVNSVKSAVYRLRKRFRKLLQEEIALTVSTEEEVEEEMRYLIEVLSK